MTYQQHVETAHNQRDEDGSRVPHICDVNRYEDTGALQREQEQGIPLSQHIGHAERRQHALDAQTQVVENVRDDSK
jgi:hypothetical protein